MRLSDRKRALSLWIYDEDLRVQHAGSILYYIEAEYQNALVREPESKDEYHQITVIGEPPPPPPPNQPPRIELLYTDQTSAVNKITLKARVTDDTSIKSIHLHYGFSQGPRFKPKYYKRTRTYRYTPTDVEFTYDIPIPQQSKGRYVWYYLTATDGEGEVSKSEPKVIEIQFAPEIPPEPPPVKPEPPKPQRPSREEPEPPKVNEPDIPEYQGIWAKYAWPREVFEDSGSIFDLNRGNAIGLTYLREGRTSRTFGVELDYSRQNPSNMSVIFQWGPALGKSPLTFTLLGGFAGYGKPDSTRTISYGTFIFGAGLKYYPWDRVAIDAIGSLKYKSNFDTTYRYHYEVGTRIYITDALNLKVGYSQWYLGSRNIARMQVGLGITF